MNPYFRLVLSAALNISFNQFKPTAIWNSKSCSVRNRELSQPLRALSFQQQYLRFIALVTQKPTNFDQDFKLQIGCKSESGWHYAIPISADMKNAHTPHLRYPLHNRPSTPCQGGTSEFDSGHTGNESWTLNSMYLSRLSGYFISKSIHVRALHYRIHSVDISFAPAEAEHYCANTLP
jgi:hypothetical protein